MLDFGWHRVRVPRSQAHNLQPIVTFNQPPIRNRSARAAPYVVRFYFATSCLSRSRRGRLSVQNPSFFPIAFSLRYCWVSIVLMFRSLSRTSCSRAHSASRRAPAACPRLLRPLARAGRRPRLEIPHRPAASPPLSRHHAGPDRVIPARGQEPGQSCDAAGEGGAMVNAAQEKARKKR